MVGSQIRTARKARGLTQQQLGEAMGFNSPKVRISNIENGRDVVSFLMLENIARELGCDVEVKLVKKEVSLFL